MATKWTILGAKGFIGSNLVQYLRAQKLEVIAADKGFSTSEADSLGNVIYAIGLTADFRLRPFDTVEAHVCRLREVLRACNFESLLYLSSTRVYARSQTTSEDSLLTVQPGDPSDLYNLSKLMGESLCLALDNPRVRIARMSNIVGRTAGSNNFIDQVVQQSLTEKRIELHTSLQSEKDYLFIDDLLPLLIEIATRGKQRIYNVASGFNVSNQVITDIIAKRSGCPVEVKANAPTWSFPAINVDRTRAEFHLQPAKFEERLAEMVSNTQTQMHGRASLKT